MAWKTVFGATITAFVIGAGAGFILHTPPTAGPGIGLPGTMALTGGIAAAATLVVAGLDYLVNRATS